MFYRTLHNRICSERGVARLVFLLAVIAALLVIVVLGVPFYHYIVDRSDAYGCGSALATANDQLRIYCLSTGDLTADTAKAEVTKAMDGWTDLCPGGGDCYIVENDDPEVAYKVVCALHDDDVGEAALLNAKSAKTQIEAALAEDEAATKVTVTLNSEKYTAAADLAETVIDPTRKTLRRAGGALISYDAAEDGTLLWFCYADENRVCMWNSDKAASYGYAYGWTVRRS